jgi:RES domain-containing protein
MTFWYRAALTDVSNSAFSGEGGLYVAGRWNYQGRRVIYCSESIALCTLEWLAHQGISVSNFTYYRYCIDIPHKLIGTYDVSDLPKGWQNTPSTDISRDFAENKLFSSSKYLAIAVPSVIVPEESNLIINPLHEAFLRISKSIKLLGKHTAPTR